MNRERCSAADALKAFAIVSVVLIHVSAPGLQKPAGNFDWYAALFWGTVSRAAVPIFLMVTGALMLDPERELSLKKLWIRNIPRLLAALLFWAFAYQLYRLVFVSHFLTSEGIIQAVKDTLLFHHEEHLYYLHIALLVYALLPALRLIAAHADRRTLEYLLGLWFLLGIIYPTVKGIWPFTLLYGIPAQYALNLTYTGMGYALLGHYLRKYAVSPWKWAALAGAALIGIQGYTTLSSLAAGRLDTACFQGTHPCTALLGAGICGWAFSALRNRTVPTAVSILARASFCIYLVHLLFLYRLNEHGFNGIAGACLIFIPLTAAVILMCSLAVWAVLSRLPGVKRWLI